MTGNVWQVGTDDELPVFPALKDRKMGIFGVFQYPQN